MNGGECGPVQSRHGLDSRRIAQFNCRSQHSVDGSQVGHARARHEFISVLEELDVVDKERLRPQLAFEQAIAADYRLAIGVVYCAVERAGKTVPRVWPTDDQRVFCCRRLANSGADSDEMHGFVSQYIFQPELGFTLSRASEPPARGRLRYSNSAQILVAPGRNIIPTRLA
tara:strand:- start:110 stop:622 length:513 start_codon:yes stop_codon:yes gene_type:complete